MHQRLTKTFLIKAYRYRIILEYKYTAYKILAMWGYNGKQLKNAMGRSRVYMVRCSLVPRDGWNPLNCRLKSLCQGLLLGAEDRDVMTKDWGEIMNPFHTSGHHW